MISCFLKAFPELWLVQFSRLAAPERWAAALLNQIKLGTNLLRLTKCNFDQGIRRLIFKIVAENVYIQELVPLRLHAYTAPVEANY